jgi:AcrR family transcriptional regulator
MSRTTYHGPIKNSERTRQKFLDAVGEIIATKGYTGLGVNKIAKQAKVDKRLMYRYFSSFEDLIETYILEKDYWLRNSENGGTYNQREGENLEEFISRLMVDQFDYFYDNKEVQGLILWEISEKNEVLNSIARTRENMASSLLSVFDNEISPKKIHFRSLSALLISGIYYMNLHRQVNDSTFCEIDINNPDDRQKLRETIYQVVRMAL